MGARSPKISVIMSVYNGAPYVGAAIESILAQTYADFELIIINDGSTDESSAIIKSYSDPRIRLFEQANRGLVPSLNRALSAAKGVYLARHDADDISHPDRFMKQIEYLESNPRIAIVGSSIQVMNTQGTILHEHHVLLNNAELKHELLIRSPFAHGSVMIRAEALKRTGSYDSHYWPAEDYELWIRLGSVGKFHNLDECLYRYREHEGSISAKNRALQKDALQRCQERAWAKRNDFVKREAFRLKDYANLPDGKRQVDRMIANIKTIIKESLQDKDIRFALKNTRLLAKNPLLYRKIAGTIKRKVSGKK